jgi:hypothetical protein
MIELPNPNRTSRGSKSCLELQKYTLEEKLSLLSQQSLEQGGRVGDVGWANESPSKVDCHLLSDYFL